MASIVCHPRALPSDQSIGTVCFTPVLRLFAPLGLLGRVTRAVIMAPLCAPTTVVSPGALRGKTRPRWKCSLMVVKQAWAILMDRWSTACCFWIHCTRSDAHPVGVDANTQADHPLHAADGRAFLDWPQRTFLALSPGTFSLAQTFPMPRCIQRMLIVSSMIQHACGLESRCCMSA